jgi:hypothetical protein
MHKLQRSWVRSQHPSAQWNLRGGRWSSAEYCMKKNKKSLKKYIKKQKQIDLPMMSDHGNWCSGPGQFRACRKQGIGHSRWVIIRDLAFLGKIIFWELAILGKSSGWAGNNVITSKVIFRSQTIPAYRKPEIIGIFKFTLIWQGHSKSPLYALNCFIFVSLFNKKF